MHAVGRRAVACSARVANEFIQLLIDEQALSTTRDNFGGVLHQFQTNTYRDLIKNLQASNPLVGRAQAAGPGFWDEAFATLTGEGEP